MEIHLKNSMTVLIDDEDADLATHRWHINGPGYAERTVQKNSVKKSVFMHRIVLERILGRPLIKGEMCDHINGEILDNRRDNLRLATVRQNAQNQKVRSDSKSGLKGVRRLPNGRWQAAIFVHGRRKYLGCFASPEQAHEAYSSAAQEYFGEYARPK